MSTSDDSCTGPIPLEPLETYMLADSDDQYPRTFVIGLEFSGELHAGAFREALAATLANEPLLTSTVRRCGFRRVWDRTPAGSVTVEWREHADRVNALAARRIDLQREAGLRVIASHSASGPRIYHVFHHACCDGIGALAMLGRLYAAYCRKVSPDVPAGAPSPRFHSIRERRPIIDLPQRFGSRERAWCASGRRAWDVLTSQTARLGPGVEGIPPESDPIPFPGSQTFTLDAEQTRELKRAARRACGTLNDLLLSAMFRTLRDWNARSDSAADCQSYRIMVPVDLRTPQHDHLPAASLVSCVFVEQSGPACDDPSRLLQSVIDRMRVAVASRSGLIMYNSIRLLTRLPGLLELVLRTWRTQATALVSYVGDAGRRLNALFPTHRGRAVIGNLVLEQITATGPVRPGTAANLTAGTYAGRLVLNLALDPHRFTAGDAGDMLQQIVENLLHYVQADTRRHTDKATRRDECLVP